MDIFDTYNDILFSYSLSKDTFIFQYAELIDVHLIQLTRSFPTIVLALLNFCLFIKYDKISRRIKIYAKSASFSNFCSN